MFSISIDLDDLDINNLERDTLFCIFFTEFDSIAADYVGRLKTHEHQKWRGGNRGSWNRGTRLQGRKMEIVGVEIVTPEGRGGKRGSKRV